ncbi:MAG: ribosomal RNA small subunit methyltransferase A [Sphingobacteriia bacterium]|nr:ribosomal RNA small subunit methyltransferase A [Sphingobacteriia bacterium]
MDKVKPKKKLGQHFLRDEAIAYKIVSQLQAPTDELVIEIGPGEGVLTQFLLPKWKNFIAIEIDEESVHHLQQRFQSEKISICHEDVLKYPFEEYEQDFSVIGNLPYNISSPIFFQLLESRKHFREGVFMIQKEVGERIAAPPGSKTYGILSVLLSRYYTCSFMFTVKPGSFFPPPKVLSGVIRFTRKPEPDPIPTFKVLKQVVKAAFNQRRKTLRNALSMYKFNPSPDVENMLALRAEQLSHESFAWLCNQIIP